MNRVSRWFGGAVLLGMLGLLAGCSDQVTGPEVNVQRASSLEHANAHHDFDKNMDDDSTKAKPKKGRYAMGAN